MTEFATQSADHVAGQPKSKSTAAQKALLDRKVLSLNALLHGAYYTGLLGDLTTVGRWHATKRCFVFWEHELGEPKLKSAPHVADASTGARFAPLSQQEAEGEYHISDFAFETAP